MNATEFRAVLDWWMASDLLLQHDHRLEPEVIATLMHNESVAHGYTGIIDAYHRHKSEGAQQP